MARINKLKIFRIVRSFLSQLRIAAKFVILLTIKFYQIAISPLLICNCCRFTPSCSQYCVEAISKRGLMVGGYLTIKRLLNCQPFSKKSGFDPVPTKPVGFYK